MKNQLFQKRNFIVLLMLMAAHTLFAQQAEIAVSSKIDVKLFSEKEIKKYQLSSSNKRTGEIMRKENEVKTLFKNQIKASYFEILKRLGQNQDVRFVKEYNPATTNFILRVDFSIFIDEIPMNEVNPDTKLDDGSYVHGVYFMRVIFELDDPHTNIIVTMFPMYQTKFKSAGYLSAQYLFNEFWISFLNTALPRTNADALSKLIKNRISDHHVVQIKFKPQNDEKPKADGKQIGDVSVELSEVLGEARKHSISRYKLTCKKGTFLETGTKEIEFTGADYYFEQYGGSNKYKTKYKAYKCKDFPKGEREFDTFTLLQTGALNKTSEKTLVVKMVEFECEKNYDIYAYYNAPGFVKAGVVWRNATIRFPGEGEKPQVFDVMAYQKAGGAGQPKGTDGKPLHLPYSMTMPMIGKQTFYGHPEDEYDTPELLYATTLGAIPDFRLNKKHNALNSCDIVSTNGGAAHLELSIDLSAGSDGEYPEQFRIYCNNTLANANLPAFPINFKVITFTQDDIEHFKKFEKVEKTVSNGKATLRVVFKPIEK